MPLYEYRCLNCDERFEVLQRMGEGSEGISCPSCRAPSIERQLSTFAGMTASSSASAEACATPGCGSPFT